MDVIASWRGFWNGLFGFYNRPSNACYPCFGIVIRFVLLDTLECVSSSRRLWQLVLLVTTFSCILRSLVSGFVRWVSLIVNCIDSTNLLEILLKVVWPFCCRLSLRLNFDSFQGMTILLKCWNYFASTQQVKSPCSAGNATNIHCPAAEQATPKRFNMNPRCDQLFHRWWVALLGKGLSQVCSSSCSMASWISPLCSREYPCGLHGNMLRLRGITLEYLGNSMEIFWTQMLTCYD
uniref:Uncharacterized protein n=1 Tax=Opuntia streptacantha TaxID=393608 RepID=A0A7C9DKS7_OPUST